MKQSSIYRATAILLLSVLFFTILYFARALLIPIVFAALLSMVLLPLCHRFEKWGISRVFSILLCLLIVIAGIAGFIAILSSQVINFANDVVLIKEKMLEKLADVQDLIQRETDVSAKDQREWLIERYTSIMESSTGFIRNLVIGFSEGLIIFGLINIYTFFFLLYRERFKIFILKLFTEDHHKKVEEIINNIKDLILHYLIGLLIALTILSVMNTIGLLALGIRQAIFLGFLAGYLNIIPYVGTLVGSLFPIMMALLFKDSMWYAVGVAAVFSFNQFIDNNITTPNIVGSHVQVNPLSTIIAILIGGSVWGIAGMILFIPLVGVFKIICDNVDDLKPIGYLLGEDVKEKKESVLVKKVKKVFKKKESK